MQALLDDPCVSDVTEADGTVKLGAQYLSKCRATRIDQLMRANKRMISEVRAIGTATR
jgi:hypothetical protein